MAPTPRAPKKPIVSRSHGSGLFKKALELAEKNTERGYLGEFFTFKALLFGLGARVAASGLKGNPEEEVQLCVRKMAYTLLGTPGETTPGHVRDWHKRGVVDVFLAQHFNLKEKDPFERCKQAALRLFAEFEDAAPLYKEKEEEWDAAVELIADRYTNLFLGIRETE